MLMANWRLLSFLAPLIHCPHLRLEPSVLMLTQAKRRASNIDLMAITMGFSLMTLTTPMTSSAGSGMSSK